MADDCIVVFTSRSFARMLADGGSQAWVLDPKRARECRYLVCAWNSTGEYAERSSYQRGDAYLVAPITSIEAAAPPEASNRYIIRFREFAHVTVRAIWNGQRNPVWYTSLQALGIAVEDFKFEAAPAPAPSDTVVPFQAQSLPEFPSQLTIAAAKRGLAMTYGVEPDAIEIVIRG